MIVTSRSTVSIRNGWYGRALPIQRKKKRFASDIGSSNSKSRILSASHPKPICTINDAEGVQTYHVTWQGLANNPEELIVDKKDGEFIPKYTTGTKHQATLKQDVSQSCITNPTSKRSLHPFECRYCGRITDSIDRFRRHTQRHRFWRRKPYRCSICATVFSFESELTYHQGKVHVMTTDTGKNTISTSEVEINVDFPGSTNHESYQCLLCDKTLSNKTELTKHRTTHEVLNLSGADTEINTFDGDRQWECPQCSKIFQEQNKFAEHLSMSHNKQKCPSCKRVFTDRRYLIEHLKTHGEKDSLAVISTDAPILERPHQCPDCKKTFARRGDLNKHLRVHTGEKPYLCDHCPKQFANKSNLTSHTRSTHTHVKHYECPICQKSVSGSSDLKKHIRIHTLEKPYRCKECPTSFATKSNLSQHTQIHTQIKKYVCQVCGKSFTQKSNLTQHARTHTFEKPYQCNRCEKSFANKSNLNKHFDTHQKLEKIHQCQHCNKRFVQKRYLIQHMRTHNLEKPFQCQYCSDSFSKNRDLTAHVRCHALVKRFGCPQCGKSFIEVQDLLDHSRIHMISKPYLPRSYKEKIDMLETAAKLNETEATLKAARPDGPSTSLLKTTKKAKEFIANPKILHMMGTSERPRYYHEKIEILQTAARLNETEAALNAARAQKSKLEVNQTSVIDSNKTDVLVIELLGYRCDHCQKSFPNQVKLQEHKKGHSLDTPYQCNYCNKSFVLEETMKAHMKTH